MRHPRRDSDDADGRNGLASPARQSSQNPKNSDESAPRISVAEQDLTRPRCRLALMSEHSNLEIIGKRDIARFDVGQINAEASERCHDRLNNVPAFGAVRNQPRFNLVSPIRHCTWYPSGQPPRFRWHRSRLTSVSGIDDRLSLQPSFRRCTPHPARQRCRIPTGQSRSGSSLPAASLESAGRPGGNCDDRRRTNFPSNSAASSRCFRHRSVCANSVGTAKTRRPRSNRLAASAHKFFAQAPCASRWPGI